MNLSMLLDMAADGLGDRVAFGGHGDGLPFAELHRLASAAAARVSASDAGVVIYADTNGPAAPIALFAAARAGASYAPLNYKLPAATIRELADRLGAAVAVAGEPYVSAL